MKTFLVFTNQSEPFKMVAETYRREGKLIEFLSEKGQVLHSILAAHVITVIEKKDEDKKL